MELLINLLPLILIIVLLILRKHMLVAGLAGAILAMIIGGFGLDIIQPKIQEGLLTTLGYITPILYAAAAAMVSKSGSIKSVVELAQRSFKDKLYVIVAILVLIQAAATFMAGTAAGNTMVIAPLVFSILGAIPEVVASMAIVGALGFTVSPASTETAMAADAALIDVAEFANKMLPIYLIFIVLAIGLAIYGVRKRGVIADYSNDGQDDKYSKMSSRELWKYATPAIILLLCVVLGSQVNKLVGITIFSPSTTIILTALSVFLFTDLTLEETCNELISGSQFILTTLFGVGIFLSFIHIIADLGLFEQLATLVGQAPKMLIVPTALVMAFLIAIPSGAFCAGVLALILPTMSLLGMPPLAMGFVAIAAGLGTQVSPVQINVAALAGGFKKDIMEIIHMNAPFVVASLGLLIVMSFVFI